jgi:hypothetical protein
VTGLTGAWLAGSWSHDSADNFFSRKAWSSDTLGMYLSRLIVRTLLPDGVALTVAVDDTGRRRSERVGFSIPAEALSWVYVAVYSLMRPSRILVGVPITYATCWYSCSRPPARSSRRMRSCSRSMRLSGSGRIGAAGRGNGWGLWLL